MKKNAAKFVILVLGMFIGLLLREIAFVDNRLMPLIHEYLLIIVITLVTITGIVLVIGKI